MKAIRNISWSLDKEVVKTLKNIIFYGTPAYGHINPTLPIVNRLVKNGYRVVYYATEEFRQQIEACGAEVRVYDFGEIEWNPQIGSHIFKLAELVLRFANEQLDMLLSDARNLKAVLILHDTIAFWGRAVAEIAGIMAVSVNPIVTVYPNTRKTLRLYTSRFAVSSLRELAVLPEIIKMEKELTHRYALEKQRFLQILMNEEKFNIFTYPREMHPEGNRMKANAFFLGASAILRNDTYETDVDYRYENLIYVSLGTIFNDSLSFYRAVMEAFADTEYTVVIACGKHCDELAREIQQPNIILKPYVNQQQIMKNARLFITAGGMNSICEAVANGVPCLVHPQQGEQAINAKVLDGLGLGKVVSKPHRLGTVARDLLNKFQVNTELQEKFSKVCLDELMDRIEKYINGGV